MLAKVGFVVGFAVVGLGVVIFFVVVVFCVATVTGGR